MIKLLHEDDVMKYVWMFFCGLSVTAYSMEPVRGFDIDVFRQRQIQHFHDSLDLMKSGNVTAWENGKSSLESSAWGVHYVPRRPGQPRKIERAPYWPAVYAVGAIALAENNTNKAFRSIYGWYKHLRKERKYTATNEGRKVYRNMETLLNGLITQNHMGALMLRVIDMIYMEKLHVARDILELHFDELQKADLKSHPCYKDLFGLLLRNRFTQAQQREQTSTVTALQSFGHFFYPQNLEKNKELNAQHFKTVLNKLDPLYRSCSLSDQSRDVVKAMLAESNRRLAWISISNVQDFLPGDFDRYMQAAAELGDVDAIYYQSIKKLPGGKVIPPEQKEAALQDLEELARRGYKDSKLFLGRYYAGLLYIRPDNYQEEDPVLMEKAQSFVFDLADPSDPKSDVDALLVMGICENNIPRAKMYLQAAVDKGNTHDALRHLAYKMAVDNQTEEAITMIENQPDSIKQDHYLLLALLHLHLCKNFQQGIHFEKVKEYTMMVCNSLTREDVDDLFEKGDALQGQKKVFHDMIFFGLSKKLQEYNQVEVYESLYRILYSKISPHVLKKMQNKLSNFNVGM